MSIFPLPVFEADADPHHRAAMSDQEVYARLEPPKTIVVRFGYLKFVGEFPYDGAAKPGCGSKLVARTYRGTEVVEMLTTTCSNSGCGKSISRKEMLDYIENSGGKDYPFNQRGRILRVATIEDLNKQSALESRRRDCVKAARAIVADLKLAMKIVEAELILGDEQITFYYMAEERVDFRELVQRLASQLHTRIEMRQVGARDEARLVADYERCGQHCCCKNFLKVLKPVSMRAAKVQKATLDPLKISGRCGRLMCCLRYEDQTYKELKANLPPRNKRVGTSEGPGVVIDSKILVQLVLVRLEHDNKEIAVPVEELLPPDQCPKPGEAKARREREAAAAGAFDGDGAAGADGAGGFESDPLRGLSPEEVADRTDPQRRGGKSKRDRDRARDGKRAPEPTKQQQQDAFRERSKRKEGRHESRRDRSATPPRAPEQPPHQQRPPAAGAGQGLPHQPQQPDAEGGQPTRRKKRRRRRRRRGGDGGGGEAGPPGGGPSPGPFPGAGDQ